MICFISDTYMVLKKLVVVDGAMATELESRGCNINDELWSAKVLAENPELIRQVHYDYYAAGADVGISASYQATVPGFMKKGFTRKESEKLVRSSLQILLDARDQFLKKHPERDRLAVAAGIGPYGAFLADGSEYTGNYGTDKQAVYEFHKERMALLAEAGAELFAFETQPCLWEAEQLLEIAKGYGIPCWVSFSCKDSTHICDGTPIRECAARMDNEELAQAIGVNCTYPEYVTGLIREIRSVSQKPIIVYPNKGEEYDPVQKIWLGARNGRRFGDWAKEWHDAGAQAIGGCCRTTPTDIAEVVAFAKTL